MWKTSVTGSPSPSTRSADVVTVDWSTLSGRTGPLGGASNSARKSRGKSAPRSFKVASNGFGIARPSPSARRLPEVGHVAQVVPVDGTRHPGLAQADRRRTGFVEGLHDTLPGG